MRPTDKLDEVLRASEAKQTLPVSQQFHGFSLISFRNFTRRDAEGIRNLLAFVWQRHSIEAVVVGGGYGCTRIEFEITSHESSQVADLVLKLMRDESFRNEASTIGFRVMILSEPYVRLDLRSGGFQADSQTLQILANGGTVNIHQRSQNINIGGDVTNSNLHSPYAILSAPAGESVDSLLDKILKLAEEDPSISKQEAVSISRQVTELSSELKKPSPSLTVLERIFGNLGSIASIASLVDQVKPFLKALFP